MTHKPFFRFLCTVMLFIYGSVSAQAGQVITQDERDWAKKISSQESQYIDISNSKSVAVLNFYNNTGDPQLNAIQKGLAFMLITDLSKIEDLVVVERIKMQALLDEMDLGSSGLVDVKTAPKVGKLLSAYYIVNGDINTSATVGDIQLGSYLLDIPFETITDLPTANGNLDDLFRMEKEILFNIVDNLNLYVSSEKKAELEKPMSISAAALLFLFQGLDYSDNGLYEKAAEMYTLAATEDPELQVANDALQELQDMGLTSQKDISRVEEQPSPDEVIAEGGSGWGTAAVVVLGLAAVGGIAVAAGSSSSSDDNDSPPPPVTDPGSESGGDIEVLPPPVLPFDDTTRPSADTNKTSISCGGDSVTFTFDEPMNRNTGSASLLGGETVFSSINQDWVSDRQYLVNLVPDGSAAATSCVRGLVNNFIITLGGFQDLAGNEMVPARFRFEAVPAAATPQVVIPTGQLIVNPDLLTPVPPVNVVQ